MSYNKLLYTSLVDKSLTENNYGWKLNLFLSIDKDYICTECQNVCKNAVSLICEFEREEDEHKDEDIELYCELCIERVIDNNANKCPISNHSNPKYLASRITRKKIMKAYVLCPNSVEYHQKMKQDQNSNRNENLSPNVNINDTLFSTAESKEKSNAIQTACTFNGTLGSLVEEHIYGCIEQQLMDNNHTNNYNNGLNLIYMQMIEDLQEKNQKMKQEINSLKNIQQNEKRMNLKMREEIKELKVNYNLMKQKMNSMKIAQEMMQSEMKMNVETNERENSMKNENELQNKMIAFLQQPLIQIPLRIHSCRKPFTDGYHPRNVLQSGTCKCYASALCSDFAHNEKDWIIFEMENNQFFLPTQIKILNRGVSYGVSSMTVSIGCVIKNEWYTLHSQSEIMGIEEQQKTLQSFELDGCHTLHNVIRENQSQWKHIKVDFNRNHGQTAITTHKFVCYEIQLFGKSSTFLF